MFDIVPVQYRLLAKVLLLVFVFGAGSVSGYKVRGVMADAEKSKQLEALVVQRQEVAKQKQTLQALAHDVEEQNNADTKKHEKELNHYRALVKQLGGLYDKQGVPTPSGGATPGGTISDTPAPSWTRLSEEATGFLLDQASKADRVVDQYKMCQKYVKDVTESIQLLQGDK